MLVMVLMAVAVVAPIAAQDDPSVIDASTLDAKMLMGYQGWFACPEDSSQVDVWKHWLLDTDDSQFAVDMWPETSELDQGGLCDLGLTRADGSPVYAFSSYDRSTVLRHFTWMQDYGIDGVIVQRFVSELDDPRFYDFRNRVSQHVMEGAEEHGRVFAIMYDISNTFEEGEQLPQIIQQDWQFLVNELGLTDSPNYLHHDGKPVVGLWGFGFPNRPGTPAMAHDLLDFFAEGDYAATVLGGVPYWWREFGIIEDTDAAWLDVFYRFDVITPWQVATFGNADGADAFLEKHDSAGQGRIWMRAVLITCL